MTARHERPAQSRDSTGRIATLGSSVWVLARRWCRDCRIHWIIRAALDRAAYFTCCRHENCSNLSRKAGAVRPALDASARQWIIC